MPKTKWSGSLRPYIYRDFQPVKKTLFQQPHLHLRIINLTNHHAPRIQFRKRTCRHPDNTRNMCLSTIASGKREHQLRTKPVRTWARRRTATCGCVRPYQRPTQKSSKSERLRIQNQEKQKTSSSKSRAPPPKQHDQKRKTYPCTNPRFLAPPSTAAPCCPSQNAHLRGGTRPTPAFRCFAAFPLLPRPTRRRSPSSMCGGRGNAAAFHGCRVRSDRGFAGTTPALRCSDRIMCSLRAGGLPSITIRNASCCLRPKISRHVLVHSAGKPCSTASSINDSSTPPRSYTSTPGS